VLSCEQQINDKTWYKAWLTVNDMRGCLADVARREFKALMQDTRNAIDSLECQRLSVLQAIDAMQRVDGGSPNLSDEKDATVDELLHQVQRLNKLLGTIVCEIEHMETAQRASDERHLVSWPVRLSIALSQPYES
jgi:hypothetical protein